MQEKARELSRKKKYLQSLEKLRDQAVETRRELAVFGAVDQRIIGANLRVQELLSEILKTRDAIFALEEELGIPHGER